MDFDLIFELFAAENELPDDPEEEALQFVSWVMENKDRPDVKLYLEDDDDGFDRLLPSLGFRSLLRPDGRLKWAKPSRPIDGADRN
jgi:hypothetical protein